MSDHEDLDLRPLEDIVTREDLHILPRHEVERRAAKAHLLLDQAKNMQNIQDELVGDLEAALNALKVYQYWFAVLSTANDPNLTLVRQLLMKYKMGAPEPSQAPGKIYAEGTDITEHPDSIEGSAVIKAELVQTEDGQMHWLLEPGEVSDAEVVEDDTEPEQAREALRWIMDEPREPTRQEIEEFFADWENEGGAVSDGSD